LASFSDPADWISRDLVDGTNKTWWKTSMACDATCYLISFLHTDIFNRLCILDTLNTWLKLITYSFKIHNNLNQ